MAQNSQGQVDRLDFTEVLERQEVDGVKLTFYVPTDVTGQDDAVSVLTLKNQLREASDSLLEHGLRQAQVDEFLAPVTALLADSSYWRLQSRGLAIFVAQDFFSSVRVPVEVPEDLTVGDRFDLLPLAPVLAADRKLYVLALAKNSVRLFDSTRNVIEELPLQSIPASFDDVVDELPERDVDVRPGSAGPGGTASFHGPDGDVDRVLLEKFLRAVGQALGTRLGTARSQLLVLATVAEYLPIFTDSCPYPAIFDDVIPGNPEQTLPDDLRSAAWQLVDAHEAARESEEQENARSLAHAAKGSFDLDEIVGAAAQGRVDTLFLPREGSRLADERSRDLANRALLGTLKTGGALRTLADLDAEVLATFRY